MSIPGGFSVSKFKSMKFVSHLVNQLITSDFTRNQLKWGKPTAAQNLQKQFEHYKNLYPDFQRSLQLPEAKLDNLVLQVHQKIYQTTSPVSEARELIRQHKLTGKPLPQVQKQLNNYNSRPAEHTIVDKFVNAALWFEPGQEVTTPEFKTIKRAISLETMYAIIAVVRAFGEMKSYTAANNASKVDPEFKTNVLQHLNAIFEGIGSDEMAQKSCARAIAFIQENGDDPEKIKTFLNYEALIPAGSQISYHFGGGYMHHGVYLQLSAIVEVLNMDTEGFNPTPETVEQNKRFVNAFITTSDLFGFIERAALGNSSDVYIIEYNKPYPLEVIKKRAMWGLGQFTNYHISEENCESFASWVFSNEFESSMCMRIPGSKVNAVNNELTLGEITLKPNETKNKYNNLATNINLTGLNNLHKSLYFPRKKKTLKNLLPNNSMFKAVLKGGKTRRRHRNTRRRR